MPTAPADSTLVSKCAAFDAFSAGKRPAGGNVVRGVRWSPDGSCLLTASEDCALRLFHLPSEVAHDAYTTTCAAAEAERGDGSGGGDGAATASENGNGAVTGGGGGDSDEELRPALRIDEGESVYDYAWYPLMSAHDPMTCCLLSTSRGRPVHLWDAVSGTLRASYVGFNHLDEVDAANSVVFEPSGRFIYAGYERAVRVFDVTRPGRAIETRPTAATRKSRDGQRGLLSCLAFSPDGSGLYAAGSFAGSIGLYVDNAKAHVALLGGHTGGVTQVQFTPDGLYLLSGARRDGRIIAWDVRNTCQPVAEYARSSPTNQRIGFDLSRDGSHLFTGSRDGCVLAYPLHGPPSEPTTLLSYADAVSGVSLHPSLPLLAVSVGERTFPLRFGGKRRREGGEGGEGGGSGDGSGSSSGSGSSGDDDDDDDDDEDEGEPQQGIEVWMFPQAAASGASLAAAQQAAAEDQTAYPEAGGGGEAHTTSAGEILTAEADMMSDESEEAGGEAGGEGEGEGSAAEALNGSSFGGDEALEEWRARLLEQVSQIGGGGES